MGNSFRASLLGATAIFGTAFTLFLIRFLIPQPVGAADNGDGWRLLCKVGARELDRPIEDHVRFRFGTGEPCVSDYVTSQEWFLRAAQLLGGLVGDEARLNLILLGIISCVLLAAALTVAVMALPLRPRRRLVAAAALWLVVADSAFFGYFASALSEAAAFVGIVLTVGGVLLMHRDGAWRYAGAAVTVAGGVVAVNAKAQTLLVLPPLLLVLLLVRRRERLRPAHLVLPVAAFTAVAGATYLMQSSGDAANEQWAEINAYHAIFDSIVDGKHDTAADLTALGLPPSFERFSGTTWWMPTAGQHDPEYLRYRDRITRRNVLRYYRSHPGRTVQILHKAAKDMLTARSSYVGSFDERSGQPPKAQEHRVPVLSGVTGRLAPAGLYLVLPLWLLICWQALRATRHHGRELGLVCLFLVTAAVGQFLLAALGEGIEGTKHQLVALFCTLLAAVFAGLSLLTRRAAPRGGGDLPSVDLELQRARVVRHVDGVLAQRGERHDPQDGLVGGGQHDRGGDAVGVCPGPVHRGDAPAVAGHQARESVLRSCRGQVVADAALVGEKLGRDDGADRVAAKVFRAGTAAAVAVEPGHRVGAARLQVSAEDVALRHATHHRAAAAPLSRGALGAAMPRAVLSVGSPFVAPA